MRVQYKDFLIQTHLRVSCWPEAHHPGDSLGGVSYQQGPLKTNKPSKSEKLSDLYQKDGYQLFFRHHSTFADCSSNAICSRRDLVQNHARQLAVFLLSFSLKRVLRVSFMTLTLSKKATDQLFWLNAHHSVCFPVSSCLLHLIHIGRATLWLSIKEFACSEAQ